MLFLSTERSRRLFERIYMKKLLLKPLAVLLAVLMAGAAPLTAFAVDTGSEDVVSFYASVESYTHKMLWFSILLDSRYVSADAQAFAFTLAGGEGAVAGDSAGKAEFTAPAGNGGRGFEVFFRFDTGKTPVLDKNGEYTLSIPAGVFTDADGGKNAALNIRFDAAEFIGERTGFFGFLDYIYNTPVLRVLFWPLIAFVELIYTISVYLAMR